MRPSKTLNDIARTFVARGVSAVGSVVLLFVVGRFLGVHGVGVYAIGQTLVLGASIFARFGMNNSLMKLSSHEAKKGLIFLRVALKKSGVISFVLCLLILVTRNFVESVFDYEGLSLLMAGMACSLPFFTAGFIFSGFFKGVRMPATACLLENGVVSFLAAGLVYGWYLFTLEVTFQTVGWAYFFSSVTVFGLALFKVSSWRKKMGSPSMLTGINKSEEKIFWMDSKDFFVMSMSGFIQSVVLLLVAGFLMSSEELGLFRAAQQISVLISFVLIVVNAVYPPKFAYFYNKGDIESLAVIARQGAMVGAVYSFPLLMVCWVFPEQILNFLGDGFSEAKSMLRIIAFAQVVNVTTGAVGFVLNMTGYSYLMRNLVLVCGVFGVVLFCIIVPLFGGMGASVALAFILIVQNVIAVMVVRNKLGFWPVPIFSKKVQV